MNNAAGIMIGLVNRVGAACLFLVDVLAAVPYALLRPVLIIKQIYTVGVLSLVIVAVSGSFVGMVLALQGYRTLVTFGAANSIGEFVALVIVRELGPVVTALLFAGRAGSSMTAEIGLMRATDQLAGLEMMAIDPIRRIIAPRFIGGFLSMPLLAAVFSVMAVGIGGGHLISVNVLGVDAGSYWSQIHAQVAFNDVWNGIVKSIFFGAVTSWIAVYQGYNAIPTPEGVATATKSTVVLSSLAILALDFVLTAFMFHHQ